MGSHPESGLFSRWATYSPRLAEIDVFDVPSALESPLTLYVDARIGIFYAPFDHIELGARLAIVGVTPGPTQAFTALATARDALRRGRDEPSIQAAVKRAASFKGMRADLTAWFDAVGLADALGVRTCEDVISGSSTNLLHTTSAVRYPTFRRTFSGWQNWNGYEIGMLEHRVLRGMIAQALGPELQALEDAIIVPLGKANEAIEHLCRTDQLDRARCVLGFPHPSPASARRHEIFAARRASLAHQVAALPHPAAPRIERDAPTHSLTEPNRANDATIRVELTGGNLRNGHFYLRRHLDFFPPDAVGPANSGDGIGHPVILHFVGRPEPVTTDIAGGNKLMFRCRREVAAFFAVHGLAEGDALTIQRLSGREYLVQPVRVDRTGPAPARPASSSRSPSQITSTNPAAKTDLGSGGAHGKTPAWKKVRSGTPVSRRVKSRPPARSKTFFEAYGVEDPQTKGKHW